MSRRLDSRNIKEKDKASVSVAKEKALIIRKVLNRKIKKEEKQQLKEQGGEKLNINEIIMGGKLYGHQNKKAGEKLYDLDEVKDDSSAFNTDSDWDPREVPL